ncbi:PH domain-containing protein, partial [Candidatus Saccharibacteria bacterium]|nr:PH domain-containing protein [Candidatus Saccharibacteria bacterium]
MKAELSQIKHARSVKEYPDINLEPDEHVVLHLKRAHIGVVLIWAVVGLLILLVSVCLIIISNNFRLDNSFINLNSAALGYLRIAIFAIYMVIIAGGFVAHNIYVANEMYITNHRAIQKSRTSLFANSTNIIKLSRVEDVSYRQNTITDHIFHIGTLRMSTVGDETTYTFK